MNRLLKRDVLAGLLFVGLAGWGAWASRSLQVGSSSNLGPGYFPGILILILVGLGVAVLIRGLLNPAEPTVRDWSLRPILFVTLSGLAFFVLVQRGGLVAAISGTVLIGAFAGPRPRLLTLLLLSLGLALVSVSVFVWALGMPLPIWPSWR
jgi:hypothetical protein